MGNPFSSTSIEQEAGMTCCLPAICCSSESPQVMPNKTITKPFTSRDLKDLKYFDFNLQTFFKIKAELSKQP